MKYFKFIKYTWWICGIIAFIIGLSVDPAYNNLALTSILGGATGAGVGALIGGILDEMFSSPTAKKISLKINEKLEEKEAVKISKRSIDEYNDAKNRFQYLSDETLESKLNELRLIQGSEMQQLALEEEMVRRGLLSHSPMHEKLDKIKSHFNL